MFFFHIFKVLPIHITGIAVVIKYYKIRVALARNTCIPDTIFPEDDVTISASNYSKGTWGNICEGPNTHLTAPGLMNKNADSNLPVEFLYIRAKADEKKVIIAWANASELDKNHFTVERTSKGLYYVTLKTTTQVHKGKVIIL